MPTPLRVLVVEDLADDTELMLLRLTKEGFRPEWMRVQTEAEYVAALAAQPDLILADWSLPQFSGLAALQLMRERGLDIPFIIVSGSVGEEAAVDALRQGAYDYVLKDRPARLGQAARHALEEKRSREERKQAEQKIAAMLRFQNEMLDTTAIWIDTLDAAGNITFWNRGAERISGYQRAEVMGHRQVWEWLYPDAKERNRAFAKAMAIIRQGERVENFETIIRRKDGQQCVIAWYSNNLVDETEQIVGSIALGADITRRKQAEDKLHQTLNELARSNAELERFAYVASHDLQEPLRMVASFVQLLAERYQGQLDADADEFIRFAVDGAQRMHQLINDLLAYSRISTRGRSLEPTDAGAVLDDALWNLNYAIEEASATVTHDPLPTVLADHTQLLQIFQNLIGNAIKFRGEVPPVVHISAQAENAQQGNEGNPPFPHPAFFVFSVRDNGIGIAPEYHDRIFGVFQRLHTRTEYPGTGIGLAICRRVIERHGGRIWVESQFGQGTTFYFTLPAAPQTASGADVEP
jgi:PAS domain S-box-containing protein